MARKRFQIGYIRVRGKHNPSWEGLYREDILLPDGRWCASVQVWVSQVESRSICRIATEPVKLLPVLPSDEQLATTGACA